MTEQEFNKRLLSILDKSNAQANGLSGIGDIFSSIANTVKSVGGSLLSGVKSFASGAVNILKSDAGKELLTTGAAIYVAKETGKIQSQQVAAQQEYAQQQNTAQLTAALAAQGININSPQGQQLIADIAKGGIVGTNGQILFPGAASYTTGYPVASNAGSGFDMKTLTPILLAATGLMAFAFILPSRSPAGRAASRRR